MRARPTHVVFGLTLLAGILYLVLAPLYLWGQQQWGWP